MEQFSVAFTNAGIGEHQLHIGDVRFLRASGTVVLQVRQVDELDPARLARWETEVRTILQPYPVEIVYQKAAENAPLPPTVAPTPAVIKDASPAPNGNSSNEGTQATTSGNTPNGDAQAAPSRNAPDGNVQAIAQTPPRGQPQAPLSENTQAAAAQDPTAREVLPTPSAVSRAAKKNPPLPASGILLGRKIPNPRPRPIVEITDELPGVTICGRLVSCRLRESWASKNAGGKGKPNGYGERVVVRFNITDYTDSLTCSAAFAEDGLAQRFLHWLELTKKEQWDIVVSGACKTGKYERELTLYANQVNLRKRELRQDDSPEKRVELHLHTKMSTKDALTDVAALFETAKRFGHPAVAITDHGVVQAFPDAARAAAKTGVKAIFGVEGYLLPDSTDIPMDSTIVAFDLETTGFEPQKCEIIEIGAVKLVNGQITDRFQSFVDGGVSVPFHITKLTGISTAMIAGAPSTREALASFAEFCGDSCLAAHNAPFDMGFLTTHGARFGMAFDQPCADTLMLARHMLRDELPSRKLSSVCEYFDIDMGSHHRADDDAASCAQVLCKLVELLKKQGVKRLPVLLPFKAGFGLADLEMGTGTPAGSKRSKAKPKQKTYHIILLAETQAGLKNLYKLISYSHLDHFRGRPLIPRSLLSVYREGLIVGAACEAGELFQSVLEDVSEAEQRRIAAFYDFLELQPIANNAFLMRAGKAKDEEALREFNRRIAALGEDLAIPVAATGDVHFLEPEDAVYRKLIQFKQGYGDAELQAPLYFKTTTEMLAEFAYLGESKAREVVIEVPNRIAARCGNLKPFPDGTHAPKLENAEEDLQRMALARARELYGDPLPPVVKARLDRELKSIVGNGFSSLYLMAQMLVQKSLKDGYLVGSRGSVGSSFVATMAGITEVNPLEPHYVCPACQYTDFDADTNGYAIGADMPDKPCPKCGTSYRKEGFTIPFEVFLGFKGEKTPDIDLNFSGEYQPVAHRFVEEMVGRNHAFRAGTVLGIAERTGFEHVKYYQEQSGIKFRGAEEERLAQGCRDVKQTTGQHPGGIVVVPQGEDIYDFTPIQHPADKADKNTVTTHFDYHALDDRLVKLDILGHDDPTALRMLEDLTGVVPQGIPLDEPGTLSLFSSAGALDVDLSELKCEVGTLGVPEFGTGFVRQVLEVTRPSTFEELVRISGLTHGTNVWLNNAEPLVRAGAARLNEVICTRDDIMNYLIARGMDASMAFRIMEQVRKGKGVSEEMERAMREITLPAWYIDSCKKIEYMFPRGHAVAYTIMAFRIAWFKLHQPKAYYATYFTVRADVFDVTRATGGAETVLKNIRETDRAMQHKDAGERKKDKDLITILEVVYEMNLRGIPMLPVDIYRSQASRFVIEDEGLRPPFSAMPGVGQAAAEAMVQKRGDQHFLSVQDFKEKTGVSSAVLDILDTCGCFDGMPKQNQISLFDF